MKKGTIKQGPGLLAVSLLVLVIFCADPGATMAAGKLKLDKNSFNVGTINEGVIIERKVTLRNIGDQEILIENISTS